MERVQLKGEEVLDKEQRYQLNKIVNSYFDKIKRKMNTDFTLRISIKAYQRAKNGNKKDDIKKIKKFSIQVFVLTTTKKLEASAADWDLNRTLHSVFKKLLSEIEHKFRVSEQKR